MTEHCELLADPLLPGQEPIVIDPDELPFEEPLTVGERLADRVASFGGSWTFILCFASVLILWVLLNSEVLAHWHRQFDPYPYILLNLFLSMLAAIQAPIIMMSQNRQAAKDRLQAAHDYEVNMRAESEIAALHAKVDALRSAELASILACLERRLGSLAPGPVDAH
jgi:uncharacterized membrane protein